MEFRVLGELEVWAAGERVPVGRVRDQMVLAGLLVDAGRTVPVDRLVKIVWDDRPPYHAIKQIRNAASELRGLLASRGFGGAIVTERSGYRLAIADPGAIDVLRFESMVSQAKRAASDGRRAEAASTLGSALGLWRGPALAGMPGEILEAVAAALNERRWAAADAYYDHHLALGHHREIIADLSACASDQPLRENTASQLMLALYRSGRQAEALDTYRRLARQLAEELGIDPCPATAALHEAILRQDNALALPASQAQSAGPATGVMRPVRGALPAALIRAEPGQAATAAPGATTPAGPGLPRGPVPGMIPPPRPAQLPLDVLGFTGRVTELAALQAALPGYGSQLDGPGKAMAAGQPGGPGQDGLSSAAANGGRVSGTTVVISTIGGTAGVGKTALAVRFAHQVAGCFPDGQLYVNLRGFGPAGTPMTPEEALLGFLHALGVAAGAMPVSVDAMSGLYRSLLANRRMLVLLDNAAHEAQARPLLPGSPGCMVLVTSRRQLTGLTVGEGAHPLTLDVLTKQEACELLTRRLGEERLAGQGEAAGDLTELCARLPLALAIVAAHAASLPNLPLNELVAELREAVSPLDTLDTGDPATSPRAVFSWSLRGLPAQVIRLFILLGQHPGPDVDAYSAAALARTTVRQAGRHLRQLARAHLIQPLRNGRYAMHDLLRAYASDLATTPSGSGLAVIPDAGSRRMALARLLDYDLATAATAMQRLYPAEACRFPIPSAATPVPGLPDANTAVTWLDTERRCLVAITAYAATHGWPDRAVQLSAVLSRYFQSGHPIDGLAIHSHALDAARQADDHRSEAEVLRQLGGAHWRLGQYDQAAGRLEQALALYREIGDRAGQARVLGNLGTTSWHLGDHATAICYQEQALALCQRSGDRFGEAVTLSNLGDGLMRLGRSQEAAARVGAALTLFRQAGDREGEATALNNLGEIQQQSGQAEEALDNFRRAIAMFAELGCRGGEAHALANCGSALTRLRLPEEAVTQHQRAIALSRAVGDRNQEAFALNGLGEAVHAAGCPADAVTYHGAALAVAISTGDREQQARAHAGLSAACYALGDPARAHEHLQRALTIYTDLGSPEAERIRAGRHHPVR